MKRILSFTLALCMIIPMTACSEPPSSTPASVSSPASVAASTPGAASDSGNPNLEDEIKVDENLLTVDVTLPASWFAEDGVLADQSVDDYIATMTATDGIKNAAQNEDGSVTVTMTKAAHTKMLNDYKASIDENIAKMIGSEDTPSVKDITYNADMTKFTVTVDKATFESGFEPLTVTFGLGISGLFYQAFDGNDTMSVSFDFVDESTGEVYDTAAFPPTE